MERTNAKSNDSLSSSVNFDATNSSVVSDDETDDSVEPSNSKEPEKMFESAIDVTTSMVENKGLIKLQQSLIEKLKNFGMDEFIKFLEAKRDAVDKVYKRQNGAVAAGSTISAVGGAVMLAGAAGTFATLGASFTLVLAGGIAVGAGTFVH